MTELTCKSCFRVMDDSIDTCYPHNMTHEQWRHELAARAMSGAGLVMGADRPMHDEVVEWAYARADAMLTEGDKSNE